MRGFFDPAIDRQPKKKKHPLSPYGAAEAAALMEAQFHSYFA
jgi:hypothetical protein